MDAEGSVFWWVFGSFVFPVLLTYGPNLWSNYGPSRCDVAAERRLLRNALDAATSVIDREDEELPGGDERRKNSLKELQGIALDAEDMADEVEGHVDELDEGEDGGGSDRAGVGTCTGKRKWVSHLLKSPFLCSKIRKVREELDWARGRHESGFSTPGADGGITSISDVARRRTLSSCREDRRRGQGCPFLPREPCLLRDAGREELVDWLTSTADEALQNKVLVIPIVAPAGCGKTSFARALFNDDKIRDHFTLRMWIWMSQDVCKDGKFQVFTADHGDAERLNLQELGQRLAPDSRYLLVLDDMWSSHLVREWEELYAQLSSAGGTGGRIIITTQHKGVAKGNGKSFDLRGPSGLLFWKIFKSCAFGNSDVVNNPNLDIGREIAKKWRASPLVLSRLGNLLRRETVWSSIAQRELWELEGKLTFKIFQVIRLSFYDLPKQLKKCFGLFSIRQMGYKFTKANLVRLWMAEGFVQAQGSTKLEDEAGGLFDELLARSFFRYVGSNKDNRQDMYVLHDLIHELALYVSDEKYSRAGLIDQNASEGTRHASFFYSEPTGFEVLYKAKGLRTLIFQGDNPNCIHRLPQNLFRRLVFIRVLDFSNTGVRDLPNTIGNLKHLRYLGLHNTAIERLPESVSSLYNLQTLDRSECCRLESLPLSINKLKGLRHLDLRVSNDCLSCMMSMPPNMGRLTGLQTLSRFLVGTSAENGIEQLKSMGNLVELCISHINQVKEWGCAKDANLEGKHLLRKLELQICGDDSQVLEDLKPPSCIEFISIKGYDGKEYPRWIVDFSFCQLTEIQLESFGECDALPSLGCLPHLKKLSISGMKKVKCTDPGFSGTFPSLEKLELANMLDLKGWTSINEGAFSRLCELSIRGCPLLVTLPNFTKLEKLIIECSQGMAVLPRFSSIHVLELCNCHEKILDSVYHLSSLSALHIISFSALRDLHQGMLSAGANYVRSSTQQIQGLSNLSSLCHLEVCDCNELECLPDQLPVGLQNLQISSCASLTISSHVLQELSSHCHVEINDCLSHKKFSNLD